MGIIFELLSQMNDFDIATEADDITGEVRQNAAKTMGGQSEDPSGKDDGEISLNTDDIFADNNESQQKENNALPQENEEAPPEEDANPDDGEDMPDEMPEGDQPKEMNQEDSSESLKKRKLQRQLLHFYEVLSGDIKLVSEYVPKITDTETIQTLGSINKNLTQCRKYIYQLITEELTTKPYEVLMKKYIAINQVYGLTIRSLDKYFAIKHEDEN